MFIRIYIVLKKQQKSRLIVNWGEERVLLCVSNVKYKLMLDSLCIQDSLSNVQAYSQINFITSSTAVSSGSGEILEIWDIKMLKFSFFSEYVKL